MKEACARYAAGRATFAEFLKATAKEWEALSASVVNRWKIPEHRAAREDIEQEMLLGAFTAFEKYDATISEDVGAYVCFSAIAAGKKKAHKLRGAKRHSGKTPSRIERPFSSFGDEGTGEKSADAVVEGLMLASGMVEDRESERRLLCEERKEEAERLALNEAERIAVEVILDGLSLDDGAKILYENPDVCLANRLGCVDGARRLINIAALNLADRLAERDEAAA
jgi:hypothetical protein